MTDETTITPAAEAPAPAVPWYKNTPAVMAILTVVALVAGGLGYTMNIGDQAELAGGLGMAVAGIVQVVNVVKNIVATKK